MIPKSRSQSRRCWTQTRAANRSATDCRPIPYTCPIIRITTRPSEIAGVPLITSFMSFFAIQESVRSNRTGRVPGPTGADARRRDAGDVDAHRRGAPTKQMPLPGRNSKGSGSAKRPGRMEVTRRSPRCSSSTMRNGIAASSSRLGLAA